MKKLLLLVLLLSCSGLSFAQRQKMTDRYEKQTEFGPVSFFGSRNYSYIVGEDGLHLKDGAYSISCPSSSKSVVVGPYTVKLTGSYNMNANHSQGSVHGAMSSNYKLAVTKYSRVSGTETVNCYQTMSGCFTNGVPNGTFNVNCSLTEQYAKLTATFKNGVLTGPFSCDMFDDDSKPHKLKGTLTTTGKLTGTWTYDGLKRGTMQFQNGVLISDNNASAGVSTPPAISAIAKQYAAGTFSKEAMLEKGYIVRRDSLMLGEYARICIVRDSGVDFEKLGAWNFPNDAVVYEYIEELCFLNEAGIDQMVNDIINQGSCSFSYIKGNNKYGYEETDADGLHYMRVHRNDKMYFTGTPSQKDYYTKVYLSDSDLAAIDAKILEIVKKEAVTLKSMSSALVQSYLDKNTEVYEQELNKIADPSETRSLGWKQKLTIREIDSFYSKYRREKREVVDGYFLSSFKDPASGYSVKAVIIGESEKEFENVIEQLKQEWREAIQVAKLQAQNERQEHQLQQIKSGIKGAFEFILAEGSAMSIAYDEAFSQYLIFDGELQLDALKILKPFCPMVGYEILNVTNDSVTCRWSVRGKKKVVTTYELTLKHDRYKLIVNAENFNIANAKVVD